MVITRNSECSADLGEARGTDIPLRILSNSRSSNNICSHVTIKVSLESEYDAKDELIQNTGAKVTTVMIQCH